MHCAEVLYRGYSGAAKQSMCVFCCPVNHRIALRSGTGEVPIFLPSSETSRFLRVSASHACMNEYLCAEIYLARANSEMQRSGIELACLRASSPLNFIGRSVNTNAAQTSRSDQTKERNQQNEKTCTHPVTCRNYGCKHHWSVQLCC